MKENIGTNCSMTPGSISIDSDMSYNEYVCETGLWLRFDLNKYNLHVLFVTVNHLLNPHHFYRSWPFAIV